MTLTDSEKLYLDRRRRGLLQREEAERLGVSSTTYRNWENGSVVPTMSIPEISDVSCSEKYTLRRRRVNMTQAELANVLGVSRYWVGLMETGIVNCERLSEYWDGREE